jgi:hypothetical protein
MSNIVSIQNSAKEIGTALSASLPASSRSTSVTQVRALLQKLETADPKTMQEIAGRLDEMYQRLHRRRDLGRGKTQKAWIEDRHGEALKQLIKALKELQKADTFSGRKPTTSLKSDDKKVLNSSSKSLDKESLVLEARLLLKFVPRKWLRSNPLRTTLQAYIKEPKSFSPEVWITIFSEHPESNLNPKVKQFVAKLGEAQKAIDAEEKKPVQIYQPKSPGELGRPQSPPTSTLATKKNIEKEVEPSVVRMHSSPSEFKARTIDYQPIFDSVSPTTSSRLQTVAPPSAVRDAVTEPGAQQAARETTPNHTLYVMPPASKSDAAAFASAYLSLAESHKPSLYLDNPASLPFLQSDITQLLQQGGTLVINLANFAAAQMASLNGLFAKVPELAGAQGEPNGLRVIGLLAHSQLGTPHPTGDFVSRFRTCREKTFDEKIAFKPIIWAEGSDFKTSASSAIIELAGSNQWRSILEAQFRDAAQRGVKKIVIAHPPEDKHREALTAYLQALQGRYPGIEITIRKPSSNREVIPPFDDRKDAAPFLVVNQANFHRLFCEGMGYDSQTNALKPQQALIDSQEKPLRLCLAVDVTESQIAFLRHKHPDLKLERAQPSTAPKRVKYGSADVERLLKPAADQKASQTPVLIDVRSPVYTSNDLFERFGKPPKQPALTEGFLLRCLQQGRTVLIRGLDERPEFKILLQSLLSNQPHAIFGDKLIRFDQGTLPLVLVDEPLSNTAVAKTKQVGVVKDTFKHCVELLKNNRALFLQGPPGAGKSFTVQKLVKQLSYRGVPFNPGAIGRRHTADFKDTLLAWAKYKSIAPTDYVFLTVDEANLAEPEFWQCLAGVFSSQPHLCLNGEVIPLTPQHKILFTGNASAMAGRSSQAIIDEHFETVQVPEMTREHLRKEVLEEYQKRFNFPEHLLNALLDLHEHCNKVFPAHLGTVRNLKNVLVRIAADQDAAYKANKDFDLYTSLLNNFLDIYGGHLAPAQQVALKQWLIKKLQVDPGPAPAFELESEDVLVTSSVRDLAGQIARELDLRSYRMADKSDNPLLQSSHRTLIIQGPPGRGKDVVAEAVLKARGMRLGQGAKADGKQPDDAKTFFTITAGVGMPALRKLIDHAKEVGAVVVISELNLLPAEVLEGEFNDLLTGEGAKPGFMLIGTINPPSYEGREPLSDAFCNRVRFVEIADYSATEQLELLSWRGVKDGDAKRVVEFHNELTSKLKHQPGAQRLPTARQLLAVADKILVKKRPVEQALEETYRFYRLTSRGAAVEPQKAEQTRPELLALAKLWWPDCPWESVTIAPEGRLPLVTKHNARLKNSEGSVETLHYALLAAIAVARHQKVGSDSAATAKHCCESFIKEHRDVRLDPALLMRECGLFLGISDEAADAKMPGKKSPDEKILLLQSDEDRIKVSVDEKPQQLKKEKGPIGAPGGSTGLLGSLQGTDAPLASWRNIQGTGGICYFATSYADSAGERGLDALALSSAAKARHGEKPDLKRAAFSVSMQPDQLARGIGQLPTPTGYAPWVKATTIGGETIEQWGLPEGKQFTELTYYLYPVDVAPPSEDKKAAIPPKKYLLSREALEQAKAFDLLGIIDKPVAQPARKIALMKQWIAQNTQYCTTDGLRQQACNLYGIKGPEDTANAEDILKSGLVVCFESADLLVALLKNFMPEVSVRRVGGYVGGSAEKVSSVGHAWVEVYLDGAWQTFDPTPSAGMPAEAAQSAVAASQSTLRVNVSGDAKAKSNRYIEDLGNGIAFAMLPGKAQSVGSAFHYRALESAVVYSAEASESASSVVFSGSKPVFIQQDLDVGFKLRPVVLTHPFLSAEDWQTAGEKIASAMWKELSKNKVKVQAYFPDGSIRPLGSVEELQAWGKLASAQPPSMQAIEVCRQKFGEAAIVGGMTDVLFRWNKFTPSMLWLFAHSDPRWKPSAQDDPELGIQVRAKLLETLGYAGQLDITGTAKLVAEIVAWKLATIPQTQGEEYNLRAATVLANDRYTPTQTTLNFLDSIGLSDENYVKLICPAYSFSADFSLFEKLRGRDLRHCSLATLEKIVFTFLPNISLELIQLFKDNHMLEDGTPTSADLRAMLRDNLFQCPDVASAEAVIAALNLTEEDFKSGTFFRFLFNYLTNCKLDKNLLQVILQVAKPSDEELDKKRAGSDKTLRELLKDSGVEI